MPHVLIIEDMYLFQQYLTDIATLAGATSFAVASTQDEAVIAARSRKPSLIMSDIKLSHGSGVTAIDAIVAEQGPIPVVYITGYPERCNLSAGPSALLTKPVTADVLLKTVRAFLGNLPSPRIGMSGHPDDVDPLPRIGIFPKAERYAASSASRP